jgi:pimeloyl-ACP methyl ester carboxylesterase
MQRLVLALLFAIIASIAYPILAYYLWREWWAFNDTAAADNYADRCLYGAIALTLMMLFGRFLIKALLSKHRPGEEEPYLFNAIKSDSINRPDGSRINIEYYGKEDGQPIIFIHGWNANSKNWYYQRKYFEKDYRLILMDLAGLGKSTRPKNNDFSLEKMAADLQAVIDHTGAHHPILWGHSMGGMAILTLLAKHDHPNRTPIKGVVLEHTTYTNPLRTIIFNRLLTAIQKPVLTPLCYLMVYLSPLVWLLRWMNYLSGNTHMMLRFLMFAGTQTAKQLDFIALLSTLAPPTVMARGILGMFRYDVTKALPTIKVPTLIIAANKDRLTKPVASHYMKNQIPNAHLAIVMPGNHQGLVERHEQVNEAAKQFIINLS